MKYRICKDRVFFNPNDKKYVGNLGGILNLNQIYWEIEDGNCKEVKSFDDFAEAKAFFDELYPEISLTKWNLAEAIIYYMEEIIDYCDGFNIIDFKADEIGFLKLKNEITVNMAKKLMKENNGNLDLSDTLIEKLPDYLTVEGDLTLNNEITELPFYLTVQGNLDIRETQIDELPKGVTVGGKIIR